MKKRSLSIALLFSFSLLVVGMSCRNLSDNDGEGSEISSKTTFYPGETVPDEYIAKKGYDAFFSTQDIPDTIFAIMQGKTFKAECTIPRSDLRYLLCLHRDIKGVARVGEMVVNKTIAADMLEIFKQLYVNNYPIERMRLIDYWDADDERSMTDNNSSSFNFRFISHTTKVSKHGAGLAVDINPLYNPYHKRLADGTEVIEPAAGKPYLDRTKTFDYKINKNDLCYRLFIQHGFEWGGDWTSVKDYQHFEK